MWSIRQSCAAFLLPLVLLASAGPDWRVFRCRQDHVTRLSPCCPEEEVSDTGKGPEFQAFDPDDGCCDAQNVTFVHASFVRHTAVDSVDLPPIVATPAPVPVMAFGMPHARTNFGPAVVDTGPPVLLKTRSLLI